MSKILKNQTNSPIFITDTGTTVPASNQYTIPPQDYLLWTASSDVIVFIGSGDLIVNDGSYDLSISDGIDLLKGIFPNTVIVDSITNPPEIPSINKAKLEYGFDTVDLPRYNESFYEVSQNAGEGLLHAFELSFNSDRVIVKVEIDGQELFEVDCDELNNFDSFDYAHNTDPFIWFKWYSSGNHFVFKPQIPLKFNTSYSIKIKANSNSNSRDLKGFLVSYEEL